MPCCDRFACAGCLRERVKSEPPLLTQAQPSVLCMMMLMPPAGSGTGGTIPIVLLVQQPISMAAGPLLYNCFLWIWVGVLR